MTGAVSCSAINTARGVASNSTISISQVRNGVFTNVNKTSTTLFSDFRGQQWSVSLPTTNLLAHYWAINAPSTQGQYWNNLADGGATSMQPNLSFGGNMRVTNQGSSNAYITLNNDLGAWSGPQNVNFRVSVISDRNMSSFSIGFLLQITGQTGDVDRIFSSHIDWNRGATMFVKNDNKIWLSTAQTVVGFDEPPGHRFVYTPSFNTWFSITLSYNATNGYTYVWVNGSRVYTSEPSGYSPANGLPRGLVPFSRYDTGPNNKYSMLGRCSKFVVYDRMLSDSEAVAVHNNFASSTGLVSGLPQV